MKLKWVQKMVLGMFFSDVFDAAKWLEKHGGDGVTALNALNNVRLADEEKFKTENYQSRQAKRTESERAEAAEARVKELEKGIPSEGSFLLSADESKVFQELLGGKKLTEFKAAYELALGEVENAKLATRALKIREVADLENLKASVLELVIKDKAVEIVEKEGKKVAMVQVDEKTQLGVLEFAQNNYPDLIPALSNSQPKRADGSGQKGSSSKGDATGADVANGYISSRYPVPKIK